MSLTLTSRDVAQLQRTLETILRPIDYSTSEEWGKDVMREVKTLLRADQAFFALPCDASVHVVGDGDRVDDAAVQYENDYWQADFIIGERRKALSLEVHHQDQLYRVGEIEKDVLYNEWCSPNKLFDTLGMAVDVSGGPIPAGVNVYHDKPNSRQFGKREKALMHLLLPAFKSTVLNYSLLVRIRDSTSAMIDELAIAACILDAEGRIFHQNRALTALYVAERDPSRLSRAVGRVGHAVTDAVGDSSSKFEKTPRAFETLVTNTNSYEVRGTQFPGAGGRQMSLVIVDTACGSRPQQHAAMRLRDQFHLTRREVEIALLLGRRMTTKEIAGMLGISMHTVRHHTESIFSKTGVSRRTMIASLIGL